MSQKRIINKLGTSEPVLDFISGNSHTQAAKRLSINIRTISSLWLLAKMALDARRKNQNIKRQTSQKLTRKTQFRHP